MSEELKARADARLDAALDDAELADPRPHYRAALGHLRRANAVAYEEAVRVYEQELVPACAGEAEPLAAWLEYGRQLAAALGPGQTTELDSTGRARSPTELVTATGLVLHIPDDEATPVLVLRRPRRPSAAQQAALELLSEGRQTASAYE